MSRARLNYHAEEKRIFSRANEESMQSYGLGVGGRGTNEVNDKFYILCVKY